MTADSKGPIDATTPLAGGAQELLDRTRVPRRRVLLLVYHRDGVETVALAPGPGVVVGREAPPDISPEGRVSRPDVAIGDSSLSRQHARFTLVNGAVEVEDLGSTNGTLVAGQRVERARVEPGDEVTLGAITASVHVLTGGEAPRLGLEGHDAFRAAVDLEMVRARFFGRSLAVVVAHAPRGTHLRHWAPRVRELVRPVDRVALYSAETMEILLPEAGAEQTQELAAAIVERRPEEPPLACGIALFPGSGTTADKLIEAGLEAARRATADRPVEVAASEGPRTWRPADARRASPEDDRAGAESPAMRPVLETAARVARSSIPVLLQGETGTGKEVLSRRIHADGPRRDRPLVCVNCGGIPAQLVESTLFGHERGAFTGATQQQKGVFESAEGGTVLLDEVGELPAGAQAALLRVLETKRITRVGSPKEIEVDVRVLAATHRDLEAMCDAGTFRLDLVYRLNAMTIRIPPLRERREDIAPLAARFLRQAAEASAPSDGKPVRSIDAGAQALLAAYAWPGNVRELKNAIERAVVIADGDTITARDLPERVRAGSPLAEPGAAAPGKPQSATQAPAAGLKNRMEQLEAEVIVEALRASDWNQTEAARRLELPLRTLQHKIKVHGIKKLGYGVA